MPTTEWNLSPTPEFIRTSRTYDKKHPDELAATLANLLHRYLPRLNHARHPALVHAGAFTMKEMASSRSTSTAKARVFGKPGYTPIRTTPPAPFTSS
jgi:hypothetical protein